MLRDKSRGSVSLKELTRVFLSKDMKVYEEYKRKYPDDGMLKFLDGEPIKGDKVCFNSYLRSGNTFLRKYIEMITGVATGSETNNRSPWPLQLPGFIGEQIVDDTVWVIKSHVPMRFVQHDFDCNKFIFCVRNPIDVI